ncbi:MAG TPA: glycine dehydrogenase (aminomethyl-transferring), partial [Pseudomonas sp.]|nr:glycine dehydrogenase (aminomethyl-transferring) [Pseudomonas sp.]
AIIESAEAAQINLRILGRGRLGVSLDETCDERTVEQLLAIFLGADHGLDVAALDAGELAAGIPAGLQRESGYLEHPVFNSHHSETEMLRYLKQLENKDLALNQA